MIRRILLIALVAVTLRADERSVTPASAGANRLDPDAALMVRAQPLRYSGATFSGGLDDLRLRDRSGREVPYLLVAPQPRRDEWIGGKVLPVARTKTTSGFEVDLGRIRAVDRLRIKSVPAPFMKRVKLEGSGDRTHYTLLAPQATIFDLPEQKLTNRDVQFAGGDYRYLRVTWDDRASAVVAQPETVEARLYVPNAPEQRARVAAGFRRIASEPGKSRYRVQLPGPHLAIDAIELTVSNPNVLRSASVSESRLTGSQLVPVVLGTSTLRKASREGVSAQELAVPVSYPESADLDLVIEDGDNGPLSIDRIDARFSPLPWIYFESPDAGALVARYGDPALKAPRYDLEANRNAVAKSSPPLASWGAVTPTASSSLLGSDVVFRGAQLKRDQFRYSRTIPAVPRSVARVLLDADVIARSSEDLSDVRIARANGEQVPYLVECRTDPIVVNLTVPQRLVRDGRSVYSMKLPYDSLPHRSRVVVTTSGGVFSRAVALQRVNDGSPRDRQVPTLATATWSNADPEHAAPPLTMEADLSGAKAVELVVDEGDNAPLRITSASVLVPTFALRFFDPGSPLTLLYGNGEASAPRYDIELLASRVMAAPARDITLPPAKALSAEHVTTELKWFWIVIVGVALILFAVLARLIAVRVPEPSQ